jgi:hypothetical protein
MEKIVLCPDSDFMDRDENYNYVYNVEKLAKHISTCNICQMEVSVWVNKLDLPLPAKMLMSTLKSKIGSITNAN